MAIVTKTIYMAANTGYLLDLGAGFSSAKITTATACELAVFPPVGTRGSSLPVAPVATQLPAVAGVITDYWRSLAAGTETFGYEFPAGGNAEYGDPIQYVGIWNEGTAGVLTVKAH